MANDLTTEKSAGDVVIGVSCPADLKTVVSAAVVMASRVGFPSTDCQEIALVVSELASNIVRHTPGGEIRLTALEGTPHPGLQIVAEDNGPGIPNVDEALTDGFSTAGSLGTGLGAVNRLVDRLDFHPRPQGGVLITCQRWIRPPSASTPRVVFGAAMRAYRFQPENGDDIVIRQWEGFALAGVIDGLGHGPAAQKASRTARQYVEHHFDQPLENLFQGVGRACRATRGVVMALVQFDLVRNTLTVANVGNVEVHLLGPSHFNPVVRRGVLGLTGTPRPVLTQHPWTADSMLIVHSDGVLPHWHRTEAEELTHQTPALIARVLLDKYGRVEDDATVLVARSVPE